MKQALRTGLVLLGAGGVLLATVTALGAALAERVLWPAEADVLYLPAAPVLRVASLGHTEMAADLVAARTNVYFGAQVIARGEHRWLGNYLDTIVTLDPYFHSIYTRGATMLIYTGRRISTEAVEKSNEILRRGLEHYPEDWEMWFQLGFNLWHELPDTVQPGDTRIAGWRRDAVVAYRNASNIDGAPYWLPSLVAKMLAGEGDEELAIQHLERTYAAQTSPEAREQIAWRLAKLRGLNRVQRLEQQAREFQEMLSRGYPYAPEAFNVIVGERPRPGVDLRGLIR